MFIDFRLVASASDTVLDQRHPVYTVEGYARRGNEWSDGMRVELEERVRKGVEEIYDRPRLFPPRSHVSRSFVSCSRRSFSHDHLENCETIPLPSSGPSLSCNLHLRTLPRHDLLFRLTWNKRRHNLWHLQSRHNDFTLFLVSCFFALCWLAARLRDRLIP